MPPLRTSPTFARFSAETFWTEFPRSLRARGLGGVKAGHQGHPHPPQMNDAADAEAICEAAKRPTVHFVPVKREETQGAAMVVFRIGELLIRQRTQANNALRGHL